MAAMPSSRASATIVQMIFFMMMTSCNDFLHIGSGRKKPHIPVGI
jgi:hypothetical protein